MRPDARSMGSCSQTRTTVHPRVRSCRVCRLSRARLSSIFSSHHAEFDRGTRKWRGQPCQKHPSKNTQTSCRRKTRSAAHRNSVTGRQFLRKRNPNEWMRLLRHRSAKEPRCRKLRIARLTDSLEAAGARARMDLLIGWRALMRVETRRTKFYLTDSKDDCFGRKVQLKVG